MTEKIVEIKTTKELKSFIKTLKGLDYITVDTEFLREKTYFAQLCLIQVCAPGLDQVALIDPLAKGIDLSPLWRVFKDKSVTKVLHACSQDMEIFHKEMDGELPTPVFDTQVAAMYIGLGQQPGYAKLVEHYCDTRLNKSKRYTDWSRRPLSDKQKEYAAADVTYLRNVYEAIKSDLDEMNRFNWVVEDMEELCDPVNYAPNPETAWLKVKHRFRRPQELALLRDLVAWRENYAIKKDRPRGHIINDRALIEVAANPPRNKKAMGEYRNGAIKNFANDIYKIAQETLSANTDTYPTYKPRKRLNNRESALVDVLQLALKICAREHKVVPHMVANKSDLETIAQGEMKKGTGCFKGWRDEVFGKTARKLAEGKATIGIENGKAAFIED